MIQYTATGSKTAVSELDSCIQGIYLDLDDLKESIKVVQVSPSKFGLTSLDIHQRKTFIKDTLFLTDELKKTLNTKKAEIDRNVSVSYFI